MTPNSPDDHHHHAKKKRVGKACDLCRIKKTKCDGKKPCSRCIADNKLCAFTDKKKHKEKNHPNGYIDLLETRLDLLTKSLEKIVLLAEPHLPFLQDLMTNARAEHAQMSLPESDDSVAKGSNYVPINEVVAYLISEMGLLEKEPVQWEQGAHIAAKLDLSNIDELALNFATHKRKAVDEGDIASFHDDEAVQLTLGSPQVPKLNDHSRTSSSVSLDSTANYGGTFNDPMNYDTLADFSPGLLQHPQAQLFPTLGLDQFPKRANLLFISNNEVLSSSLLVLSLTNRFENQDLEEFARRRGLIKGPISPSHQKMKLSGHVHKRGFQSHPPQSSVSQNFISNNGNEFHFPKQFSSSLSLPDMISSGLSKELEIPAAVFDNDFLFDDVSPQYDYGDLAKNGIFEGDDMLLSNAFVK